jgi:hypothetical protein
LNDDDAVTRENLIDALYFEQDVLSSGEIGSDTGTLEKPIRFPVEDEPKKAHSENDAYPSENCSNDRSGIAVENLNHPR